MLKNINCRCGKVIPRGNYSKHLNSSYHFNYIQSLKMEKYKISHGIKKNDITGQTIALKSLNNKKHGGSILKTSCTCNNCLQERLIDQIKKKEYFRNKK